MRKGQTVYACPQCRYPMSRQGCSCPVHGLVAVPLASLPDVVDERAAEVEVVQVGENRWRIRSKCPPKEKGQFLSIAPPPFRRGFSIQHGKKITSWSEYRAANREAGLVDVGYGPGPPRDTNLPPSTKRGRHMPVPTSD